MDICENHNTHQKKAGTLKEELQGILIIGTLILIFLSLIVKKYDNKRYLIFFCVFTPRIPAVPNIGLWTLRPRFLRGFPEPTIEFSTWSAVSHLKSHDFRFHEPAILFSPWSAVSHLKSRDFRFHEPTILFSNWSAVSPSKTRDFRLYEPTIPFYPLVSGIPSHFRS